jgi:hypothetical protein
MAMAAELRLQCDGMREMSNTTWQKASAGLPGAEHMARRLITVLVVLLGFGSAALATELNLRVEASGCHASNVTIGPSCETPYRVIGELTDAESDGLAMVVFDLEFDGGGLSPADTPTDLPMASFAPPAGLSNPDGYGGTPVGGKLVQVGGSQNIIGHGLWGCETEDDCPAPATCVDEICSAIPGLPLGTVVLGVAQPGAPASIATGTLITPAGPGTYTLHLTSPVGNVVEKGADGRPYWWNDTVGIGTIADLSITVQPGLECCDVYEACCLGDDSCMFAPPAECVLLGGVPSGLVCEEDADGDGVDGTCGDDCPNDPNKLTPGVCGCGVPDTDTDTDGTPDCIDGCPLDPDKTEPGVCGCGVPDTDTDSDSTPDCIDGCPTDPDKTEPGDCGCGVSDDDSDGDTVPDCHDVCPGEDDTIDEDQNGIPDCYEDPHDIPAVSAWGMLILTLLMLAAYWVYRGRRREA